MLIRLPQAKTYVPGPGRCIYCAPDNTSATGLTREHIIARKLGGQLILHQASCKECARTINSEIETPTLTFMWISARTHLGLPTDNPREELKVGTWEKTEETFPQNMSNANFQWKGVPVADHPFRMMLPLLAAPGILSGRPKTENFQLVGMDTYHDGKPDIAAELGRQTGELLPFSPNILGRMIAKIAHGAAVAELGISAFVPFLPDIIMGRSPYISHFVGSSTKKGRRRDALHEITLDFHKGFLIAEVQMFAKLGLRAFQTVVGQPLGELSRWQISSPLISQL